MIDDSFKSLKPGDIVEILQPLDILKTLDSNGQLDGLPFMPEMIPYCGKQFKVLLRVEKTCVNCIFSNDKLKTMMKEFTYNDVVFLEDLRCTGIDHGYCQRGCMIFWKQAWLKKVNDKMGDTSINPDGDLKLRERLKNKKSEKKYFCQSTELSSATKYISPLKRLFKTFKEVTSGGLNVLQAIKAIILPTWRKLNKIPQPKGSLRETPIECLDLKAGELVEVRPFNEILPTLNKRGQNKGLKFTLDMKQYCGKQFKVRNKLIKMIREETGEMLEIKNTVILEEATCTYPYLFAGCPRAEFHYWREIWLKRINE